VSADLERDLGAWARGELARNRLLAVHGESAAGTVALHERLALAAASVPLGDVEAGWASLLVKLDAPAPVVPLRRHARGSRTTVWLVAATLVLAGAAFAAIWRSDHRAAPASPSVSTTSVDVGNGSEVGGPNDRSLVPPPHRSGSVRQRPGGSAPGSGSPTGSGTNDVGTGGGPSSSPATDDPHDRDHGTGNDGSHDDKGSGNDGSSGSLPKESQGKSH
jgi:hypothetical protein